MRTHFLSSQERQETREFYESAFPEDSKEFVDFYYQWVVGQNDIFVADRIQGDRYWNQAMVHINRHMLSVNGSRMAAPYLVAVATRPECRRQAIMHGMLERALQDMYRRQYAFAFLMPANPAYYTGLGFRYFPNQPGVWQAQAMGAEFGEFFQGMSWRQAGPQDIARMCPFANRVLRRSFQLSIFWEEGYVKRLLAETAAEQGGVLLLEAGRALQGILAYGMEEGEEGQKTAEIKDILLSQELTSAMRTHLESAGISEKRSLSASAEVQFQRCIQEAACRAALPGCAISFPPMEMMVRILDLFTFVPLLQNSSPQTLHIEVKDAMIPSNGGPFDITLGPEGGRICRPPSPGDGREQIDIADLTEILLKDVPVSIHEWV